jgi:CRISPR/Cas system-associated exonuclease Cas4 (RecB family)
LDRWAVGERATERGAIVHANEFINQVWNEREQRIIEIRNGLDIDSTQLAVYLHLVRSRLERFFQMIWPQFSDMRHESHESLQEFRGCALPVGVKIDLACWNREDQLVIADWKTGSWQNLLGSRVQLAVYALWARTALKLGIAAILPTIVSLQTGEIERFHPTEDDFDFVKDEVESDKRRVEDYRRAGEFPASPRPEKCWGCAYLSSCREGSETVGL